MGSHVAASLDVRNGSTVSNKGDFIGDNAGGNGLVTVHGSNDAKRSSWSLTSDLYVGGYSTCTGILTINDEGTVASHNVILGNDLGARGTVNVDGAGSSLTNTGMKIGNNGVGELNITGGGAVNTTSVGGAAAGPSFVGQYASGLTGSLETAGAVTINGGGSKWTSTSSITLGGVSFVTSGVGVLTVQNGGALSATGGLTVAATGKLQGNGTVTANVNNSGIVAQELRASQAG